MRPKSKPAGYVYIDARIHFPGTDLATTVWFPYDIANTRRARSHLAALEERERARLKKLGSFRMCLEFRLIPNQSPLGVLPPLPNIPDEIRKAAQPKQRTWCSSGTPIGETPPGRTAVALNQKSGTAGIPQFASPMSDDLPVAPPL